MIVDPAISLFHLCSKMKWAHLPVAGGLYDQDPEILRKFEIIFGAIDRHEKAERDKQDREVKRQSQRSSGRRGRR